MRKRYSALSNDRNQVADQRFSLSNGLLRVRIVEGSGKQKNRLNR